MTEKKILIANNFYYNRGGASTYVFDLSGLLNMHGNKVIPFSMHHPMNFKTVYSKYFISHIDYAEEIKRISPISTLKVGLRCIFSLEANKKIENLIRREKPDIAHIQSIHHHITPSILYVLKKFRIPIIWTLHDFVLICPNTNFFYNDQVCEKCKYVKYFWAPLCKCKKNSFFASFAAAVETTVHRMMRIFNYVDIFISPSEFLRKKFIEFGYPSERIVHLPNPMDPIVNELNYVDSGYCLYAGRLAQGKGLKTLIDATIQAGKVNLKIVGNGPLMKELVSYVKSKDNKGLIKMLGQKSRNEVIELLKRSNFSVVPSELYENFPYSVLEAFAIGKPVIGSRIGGIPELIDDGINGFLFPPKDVARLSELMCTLSENHDRARRMGENAKKKCALKFNSKKHYNELMKIYQQAAGSKFIL